MYQFRREPYIDRSWKIRRRGSCTGSALVIVRRTRHNQWARQGRGLDTGGLGPSIDQAGVDKGCIDQGSVVLLTLNTPREKVVGVLLRLAPAGVELRCVALESLDDLARQIRAGEPAIASTVFFPMHRVERMELDESAGELPSLAQSFAANAGRSLQEVFSSRQISENPGKGHGR